MRRKIMFIGLLLFLLLLPAASVGAAQVDPFDRIIREGETVREDVAVFGGNLVVEEGATVEGDVSLLGGTATLAGDVDGSVFIMGGSADLSGNVNNDLVILGGNLAILDGADVDGDCVLVGGTVSGDGAAELGCTAVRGLEGLAIPGFVRPGRIPDLPGVPDLPGLPSRPAAEVSATSHFFGRVAGAIGQSLILGLLALLVGAVAPMQLHQVSQTLRDKPAASGVVGFLTAVAGPSLAVLLLIVSAILTVVCIGLLGFPIVFVLLVMLSLGALVGWVAAGSLLGQRLARWLKLSNASPAVVAALGTAVLTLAAAGLSALPFFLGGWFWALAGAAIAFAGLGAVALTRFGTRPYPLLVAGRPGKMAAVMDTLPPEKGAEA